MSALIKVLTDKIVLNRQIESIAKVLIFAFLTFLGSMVRIYLPWSPVPITLQTFFLFISVYYLNPREIGLSQSIYILTGLVGLPVFAAGITGMLALVGPTAGYLLGFIVAGVVMSILKEKIKIIFSNMFCIFILGTIIVYFFGVVHLCVIYKTNIITAIKIGITPFIIGDLIKISVATIIGLKSRI